MIGIIPKYDLFSGPDDGNIMNNIWHVVNHKQLTIHKDTFCPTLSDNAPKIGAKKAEIR